jgi:hypothetical protein
VNQDNTGGRSRGKEEVREQSRREKDLDGREWPVMKREEVSLLPPPGLIMDFLKDNDAIANNQVSLSNILIMN